MASPSPLLEALDEVGASAEASSHRLLLLDFDGTLAPIAVRPGLARSPATTRGTGPETGGGLGLLNKKSFGGDVGRGR